jgi:predicted ATP-grasp superfamily ATP-dependent carboligase
MRVLVLDGNENQAVACVRSLARAGHRVLVGSAGSWSKAGWSRSAAGSFRYPAPQADAAGFVRRVAEEAAREPGTLVLPMTERTTLPLSERRANIFEAGGRLVLPSVEAVRRAFNKEETTRLAASLGVAVPRTETVADDDAARRVMGESAYPVVLKPRSSEEVSAAGGVVATGAPRYARDAREFAEAYADIRRRASAVLVQEFVEGQGAGYFALMREGEPRAEFAHRRVRDVRPTGSGSAVRVSVRPDPVLREQSLALLGALQWHGVAMVEFRVRPDGTPVFMEVNGRFWNSLPLAVHAGADFPAMLAELAERGDVQPRPPYAEGVRCRWLLGDFRHLVEVFRGAPAGYAGEFPRRAAALREFLRPVAGTRHDNFEWRDPLPELGDWLDFTLRRLPGGLNKLTRREEVNAQRGYSHS